MTLEEAHANYLKAKEKYENAIENKNQSKNELYNNETIRKQSIQELNDLQNQQNRFLQTQESMSKTNVREELEKRLGLMSTEMGDASDFFKTIASSDDGEINLSEHIMNDDEKKKSYNSVDSIFTKIKSASDKLNENIETLRDEVRKTEEKINNAEAQIKQANNNIDYWESVRLKQLNKMEIYKALEKKLMLN